MSEFNGKRWLPKKVSKESLYTETKTELPEKRNFLFMVLDMKKIGFVVTCLCMEKVSRSRITKWLGVFALTGCKGFPEPIPPNSRRGARIFPHLPIVPEFKDTIFKNLKYRERGADESNDLAVRYVLHLHDFLPVLGNTARGHFKITYPHQMSIIDYLIFFWQYKITTKRGQSPVGYLIQLLQCR